MTQDRLERIRLLSRRFHELQGLRVALTGACMSIGIGSYLIATPKPTGNGTIIALLTSFVPVVPGVYWLNRYYARTFGRQVSSPPRDQAVYTTVFVVGYLVVTSWLNHAIPAIPAGGPTIAIVGLASLWVAIRDWPWRAYYAGITAVTAVAFIGSASAAGFLSRDSNMTLGMLFLAVGASMVPAGVLDHLLLQKLIKEAREPQLEARPNREG